MNKFRAAVVVLVVAFTLCWSACLYADDTAGAEGDAKDEDSGEPDMTNWTDEQKKDYYDLKVRQALANQKKATQDAEDKAKYGDVQSPTKMTGAVTITQGDASVSKWAAFAAARRSLEGIEKQLPKDMKCTSIALVDWQKASLGRARLERMKAQIQAETDASPEQLRKFSALPDDEVANLRSTGGLSSPVAVTKALDFVVQLLGYFRTETSTQFEETSVPPEIVAPVLANKTGISEVYVPFPTTEDYKEIAELIDGMLKAMMVGGGDSARGDRGSHGDVADGNGGGAKPKDGPVGAKDGQKEATDKDKAAKDTAVDEKEELNAKRDLLIKQMAEDQAMTRLIKDGSCMLGVTIPDAIAATTTSKALWRSDKVYDRGSATIAWNLVNSLGVVEAAGLDTMVCEADNKLSRRLNRTDLKCRMVSDQNEP